MIARTLLTVEVIAHKNQRYETAGDWWFGDDGALHVRASDVGDDRYALLIALHEAVEALACREHGVTDEAVCAFDRAFNAAHDLENEEPGEDPAAPYFKEHAIADVVERLAATQLGVVWRDYEAKVDSLFKKKEAA